MLPRLVYADTSALIPGADVCALTPEVTEGPYYLDTGLLRRDITEGRPGVPLALRLQVVDAACQPVEGARVDLWHCDAQGIYSSFGGDSGQVSAAGETFLRGTQMADARGIVHFATIYPGWYHGRTTHMHFKVWLSERQVLTGQIFFPDALSEYLYAHVDAYARAGTRDTFNGSDGIAQQASRASFAAVTEGDAAYLVQMIVGVDPMADSGASALPPMPAGDRPPGPPPGGGENGTPWIPGEA
ncbi:MAG: intradiol ring-cleavage dioxygenase [Rhodobacteraceae bacterium]|nr:intradiol ring-cleavage dioxygenase [Paracoccaceae bacterium]